MNSDIGDFTCLFYIDWIQLLFAPDKCRDVQFCLVKPHLLVDSETICLQGQDPQEVNFLKSHSFL